MKVFCFGFGFTANALAARLTDRQGVAVAGTRTRAAPPDIVAFDGHTRSADVVSGFRNATHMLVSVPPSRDGCPVLKHFASDLAHLNSLRWVGYLSTVGVYGDVGGAWVDETTPVNPKSERARRRVAAERGWLDFGAATGGRIGIFRLPGIYGPGRSPLDTLKSGTAKRVIKPAQVFNRIHVADIAGALDVAMATPTTETIFNITDDEPAPPQDVVTFAAALLGVSPPPEVAFDGAALSPMAASFYDENKRVSNTRLKTSLGYQLQFPNYREGLRAIHAAG